MRVLRVQKQLTDEEADALAGVRLGRDEGYDILLQEPALVLKEDGRPLAQLCKKVLLPEQCRAAWEGLKRSSLYAAGESNRGIATGKRDGHAQHYAIRKAGYVSNTRIAFTEQNKSGIIGFYDRYTCIPYCRQTAFNANHPELFAKTLPLLQAVSAHFAEQQPARFQAQQAMADRTHPDFIIPRTCFTTITVNDNWQTAVHKDKGDYPEGMGVMTVLQAGHYSGGYLVFPQYRVAVDLRSQDVLFSDVHEWHGNTPIIGHGPHKRLSLVCYFREKMIKCGSAAEELRRAQNRKPGDPLYDD